MRKSAFVHGALNPKRRKPCPLLTSRCYPQDPQPCSPGEPRLEVVAYSSLVINRVGRLQKETLTLNPSA